MPAVIGPALRRLACAAGASAAFGAAALASMHAADSDAPAAVVLQNHPPLARLAAPADDSLQAYLAKGRAHLVSSVLACESALGAVADDADAADTTRLLLGRLQETVDEFDRRSSAYTSSDDGLSLGHLPLTLDVDADALRALLGGDHHTAAPPPPPPSSVSLAGGAVVSADAPVRLLAGPPGGPAYRRSWLGSWQTPGESMWARAAAMAHSDTVPIRKVRLRYTGCHDELDFKRRVHCFREAMTALMASEDRRAVLRAVFTEVIAGLLRAGRKDPSDFLRSLSRLEVFIEEQERLDGLAAVANDLKRKGIVHAGFFDFVYDYLLFDTLDLIESPPKSVMQALRNPRVPERVRSKMLYGTVWGISKARYTMENDNTIMRSYYKVMMHVVPTLTGGFLGVGDPVFVALLEHFKTSLVQHVIECFELPTQRPDMTPDEYADEIVTLIEGYGATMKIAMDAATHRP